MEKRNNIRIKTHSAAKLVSSIQLKRFYGYLDNLSENGMGIISPDKVLLGSRFTCGFFLGDSTEKINTIATVVRVQEGNESVRYYGLRFDYISTEDRRAVSDFIAKESMKSTSNKNIVF